MKILFADDHLLLRDVLKSYVERESPDAEVHLAANVSDALAVIDKTGDLDIIILDYHMPGMNGFEGLVAVRERVAGKPVAIMSGVAGRDEIREAISKGAAGFLPKTLSPQAMIKAIDLMVAGERFLPASHFDPASNAEDMERNSTADPAAIFSRREREVLSYLFKGNSNKEIARELGVQEVTIKLHVRSLCKKLDAKNRTHAVMRALDLGISS